MLNSNTVINPNLNLQIVLPHSWTPFWGFSNVLWNLRSIGQWGWFCEVPWNSTNVGHSYNFVAFIKCVVSSLIYGFWLPLWYLKIFRLSASLKGLVITLGWCGHTPLQPTVTICIVLGRSLFVLSIYAIIVSNLIRITT